MFTGIISDIGEVTRADADGTYTIKTGLDLACESIGASIACDGCCLTVTEKTTDTFTVHVSPETKDITTLTRWKPGYGVNLESALKVGETLGGHMMTGHVDGLARLSNKEERDGNYVLTFDVPEKLKRFIAPKGSITLNGVSLTVNKAEGSQLSVNIIPHTWKATNLSTVEIGAEVNLEIDTIARYLDQLLQDRV